MTIRRSISASIRRAAISMLLLMAVSAASAQIKFFSLQKDSIPVFRGFSASFDVAGAAMMALSDYGQYEGALRINLHDEWFPIVEAGYGKAKHDDVPDAIAMLVDFVNSFNTNKVSIVKRPF